MTTWRHGTIRTGPTPSAGPVVKLGGSILTRPGWPAAVAALLRDMPAPLVVVGGGRVVDGLRAIDATAPQPVELMHALAIDAMSLTARIAAAALGLAVVERPAAGGVLDAAAWLRTDAAARPPAGWHVTSDSIAAAVAGLTGRGLLLVKSTPPPDGERLEALAASGWVDPHFPVAAAAVAAIAWAAPG